MSFTKAFGLAALGILPLTLLTYGPVFPVVYIMVALLGVVSIVSFSLLTSIFDNHAYKFLIFVLAVCWVLYGVREQIAFDPSTTYPGAINITRLLVFELLFLFPLFYFLLERAKMRRHTAKTSNSD